MLETIVTILLLVACLCVPFLHTPLMPCPHKENRLCSHRRNPDGTCPIKEECINRELATKMEDTE